MSGYWEKRAMADEQRAHRAASEVNADIKRLYQRQYRKIYASMERLYGQADWGEAHRITRTQLWQYSHWKTMEQDLRQFAADTPKIEIEKLTGTLNGIFKDTIGADVSRFSGQEGVTFRVSTDPMTVVNTAWSGEAYSSRIWKNTSAIAERIQSDMEDMMVSGRSLKDIKKQLMQDFSIGYNEAARLVDTEAAYVMNSAAKQRYKADGITKIRWLIGMEDGKECEICKSRANKVWHIDTAPPMPAHPRCRCCWAGVVELPGEYVPCDGEGESAQEAQTVKEPRTVKEAKAPEETTKIEIKTIEEKDETWYNENVAGNPETERKYTEALEMAKRESGIKGTLKKPEMPENIEQYAFDENHIHNERGRNISNTEAIRYVKNAVVSIERGPYLNFYSEEGGTYIIKKDRLIRTAFKAGVFNPDVRRMLEVILNELRER